MLLQGHLQTVFDALYDMGVIEPVLKMDWMDRLRELEGESTRLRGVARVIDDCGHDPARLQRELRKLDGRTLEFLAMEVAREYAEYHARTTVH